MSFLLRLADPWAYVLLFVLAAAEASAFVGLFVPGETAMLIAGVVCYQGRASLWLMIVVGCLGAVIGDSIGYEVGRKLGPRMTSSWLGRRIGDERWRKAQDYLRRRGGRAVFLGRFVGVLRALVPGLAGMAEIPYGTFLAYNVAGGVTWATGFILLGYAAGRSYHVVEDWAGRASLLLLIMAVAIVAIVFLVRWIAGHREDFRARWQRFLERPRIARFRSRRRRQLDWLAARFDPGERFGLFVTAGLVLIVLIAWAFGSIVQDVIAHDELSLVDRPMLRYLVEHRTAGLTTAMKVVTFFGSNAFIIPATLVVAAAAIAVTRKARWAAFLTGTVAGAYGLFNVLKALVDRPRPMIAPAIHVGGSSFPSGHATVSAAFFLAVAYVVTRRLGWKTSVWVWATALVVPGAVAFSRVYLGVHWPTDVGAGLTLGAAWTAIAATATGTLDRPRTSHGGRAGE
ncbi:MAG: bifunctional DedA family/phosphatase PAP2 family protein [Actinomycetota bacterium]